jgi:hypothetical protein
MYHILKVSSERRHEIRCVAQHDRAEQLGRGLSAWSSCDSLMELQRDGLDFDDSLGCCWAVIGRSGPLLP